MTYQFLTIEMIRNISPEGFIDQSIFKTSEKYGFDSLIFSKDVVAIINGYITCIRNRLNPCCNYLLISRNGKQLSQLSGIFGRIVYQAIGKYINPTRYRQIIETESSQSLDAQEQEMLSEDQKHTSQVAKVHYKKQQSREVAQKGKHCMEKLRNENSSQEHTLKAISTTIIDNTVNFDVKQCHSKEGNNSIVSEKSKKNRERQKKVPFSKQEDKFLSDGLRKHGNGKWTAILYDSEYCFHSSRKACTLLTRAKSQGVLS